LKKKTTLSNGVDEIQEEMTKNMHKKYEALSVRYYPISTASKPTTTTPIPDITIPQNLAYQLASKTVNDFGTNIIIMNTRFFFHAFRIKKMSIL